MEIETEEGLLESSIQGLVEGGSLSRDVGSSQIAAG